MWTVKVHPKTYIYIGVESFSTEDNHQQFPFNVSILLLHRQRQLVCCLEQRQLLVHRVSIDMDLHWVFDIVMS